MKNWKRIPENRLAFLMLTAMALFLVGLIIATGSGVRQFNFLVVATMLLNIGLFTAQLLRSINRHAFSFDMMHWLFCLFFLGLAPLAQHLSNTYSWALVPTYGEIVRANLLFLLWAVCYILGRDYREIPMLNKAVSGISEKLAPLKNKLPLPKMDAEGFQTRLAEKLGRFTGSGAEGKGILSRYRAASLKTKILDLLLLAAVVCALADILAVGLIAQISRNTAAVNTGNTAIDLIATHGVNNLLLFVAAVFVLEAKKEKKIRWRTLVALGCLGIACFPTGLSRNMMASFYAGMLILMLDWSKKGRWFSWVIFGGLILIFPAVEVFRWLSTLKKEGLLNILLNSFGSAYVSGHFDAHQMIVTISRYVADAGFAWGKQILGALLFFVPRSIWPGKPEGTGHTAIVHLDQFYFSNASATMAAEGYVNFGLVGVVVLAVLFGLLVYRVDRFYWRERTGFWEEKNGDILYPFAMFMFFFLLRGDMMSAWAYTFAQLMVGLCVLAVYRFAVNYGEK